MNKNTHRYLFRSSHRKPHSKLLLFVALALSASGVTTAGTLSPDLQAALNSGTLNLTGAQANAALDVIVQFNHPPAATDLIPIQALGGGVKKVFQNIPGAVITVPVAALHGIANVPNVKYISPDRKLSGALEFAEPTTNANIAFQYGWDGTGVGVAIIDSGIYASHPDLRPRVVYSENFVATDTTTDDPYGHGTHVAGIVGGNGSASTAPVSLYTFRGIAPNSNLINLRALDPSGQGTDSSVIAAIDRAIQLKNQYGIRVINLSLGRSVYESYTLDPLCQEVENAWNAGLVVVVAAGNNGRDNSMNTNGYSTITAPGNDPYVITVGATKDMGTVGRGDDLIASYSSKGPTLLDQIVKPDIVAPGNNIISALAPNSALPQLFPSNAVPVSYYMNTGNPNTSSTYFRLSGTSMAAPMVTGAAALLLQQQPSLTPDQVKARLMKTATKNFPSTSVAVDPITGASYTSAYDIFTIGAGYLDVWAALNNTDLPAGSAQSPTAVYDSNTGTISVLAPNGSVWQNAVVWGSTVVWGTNVINASDEAVVWGTGVVWGTNTTSGFAVVWGTTVVWGTNAPGGSALPGE